VNITPGALKRQPKGVLGRESTEDVAKRLTRQVNDHFEKTYEPHLARSAERDTALEYAGAWKQNTARSQDDASKYRKLTRGLDRNQIKILEAGASHIIENHPNERQKKQKEREQKRQKGRDIGPSL